MRRCSTALAAASLLLACHRTPTSRTPTDDGTGVVDTANDTVDRAALADAIDPGPQRPLTDGIPEFMLGAIGIELPLPDDVDALVERSRGELQHWEDTKTGGDLAQTLTLVMGLGRGVVYGERALEKGASDPRVLSTLERMYDLLDAPLVGGDRNMFSDMVQMFVQGAIAKGDIKEAAQVEAISGVVFSTVRAAAPAHRHAVAQLLRSGADDKTVAEALSRVTDAVRRDDEALGLRVARAAVVLAGDEATPALWFTYAAACHRALELTCGTEALAKAEAAVASLDDEDTKKKAASSAQYGKTLAAAAQTAVAQRGKKDLKSRYAQARALLELSRGAEAEAALKSLRADFPKEAAPVTGLAMHAVNMRLDMSGASQIIDDAGPDLLHKDVEYYEIAVGTRATRLVYDILPQAMAGKSFPEAFVTIRPMIDTIRDDVAALVELGDDDAVALQFLLDLGIDELVPKAMSGELTRSIDLFRGLLPRAVALRGRVPDDDLAWLIVLAVAQFSPDREAALAAVMSKPPTADDNLARRQTGALMELVVMWEAAEHVPELLRRVQKAAEGIETGEPLVQLGDAYALSARLSSDASAWPKAEAAYRKGLEGLLGTSRERPLNNLAVAVAEQGRSEEAILLLGAAGEAGGEDANPLSVVNMAALSEPSEQWTKTLTELTVDGKAEARRLAQLWLVHKAGNARDRKQAEKALTKLLAEQAADEIRPTLLPDAAGVALAGTLNAGLGYSTKDGLTIELVADSLPWLVVRPPSGLPFRRP